MRNSMFEYCCLRLLTFVSSSLWVCAEYEITTKARSEDAEYAETDLLNLQLYRSHDVSYRLE